MRGALHHASGTSLRGVPTQPWQVEVGKHLEEHHLCASSDQPRRRERFVIDLGTCLSKFQDTDVCTLDGSRVHNVDELCREMERALGVGPIGRSVDGEDGLVGALRRRPPADSARAIKRRYIIFSEAHVLLREDPRLFGRAADAIMGVAAEHEFFSDDVLLIQRGIFVGRAAIDVYAEDPRGQFLSWFSEGREQPLWKVVSGQKAPHVARWRIGPELDAV